MIQGYITRGTTIRGKSVNQGETHEMDADTFRALKAAGFVTEVKLKEEQKPAEVSAAPIEPPKKKGK